MESWRSWKLVTGTRFSKFTVYPCVINILSTRIQWSIYYIRSLCYDWLKLSHTTAEEIIYFTSPSFFFLSPKYCSSISACSDSTPAWCFNDSSFKNNYSKPQWLITIIYLISRVVGWKRPKQKVLTWGLWCACDQLATMDTDIWRHHWAGIHRVQPYGWKLTMASSWELSGAFNEQIFGISPQFNRNSRCIDRISNTTALELRLTLGKAKPKTFPDAVARFSLKPSRRLNYM